ncbi:LysR family transcriptional regulator [Companilactobacillus ginsenosidimutans]|uniref:LysR family transcriptional regulator n=1 Tax=Companilactobacillus ginsenosidimutans TaxID=1007676 RepID=A0A0H4QLE3_9LACO|nr:LysR family transcriptional regulator [Companilactobacillus ginsenosidimutans]AKP67901.1 LysR family transcriptional regulator [Companilactobacillus ginsenosidimutans]
MNLNHLVYFRELAHTQHMSKAAHNLGISQPTLSYAIDNLEKQLGVPLFEHEGRNIKLSRFGQIYLKFISSGIDNIQRGNAILEQLLNVNEGNIQMAFPSVLGEKLVPELISSFKHTEDTENITFDLYEGEPKEILTNLLNEKYDFALAPKVDIPRDKDSKEKLDFLPIIQQEIMLAVPVNHPLAKLDSVEVSQISGQPFIGYTDECVLFPLINKILENGNVVSQIKYKMRDTDSILGFVTFGAGIALVPHITQYNRNKIKLIHLSDNKLIHQIYLAIKDNRFSTPSVSRFQNFLTRYCKENYKHQGKLL